MKLVTLVLPSRDEDGSLLSEQTRTITEVWVARRFSTLFGGCTVSAECKGYWYDEHGTLIAEGTRLAQSVCEDEAYDEDSIDEVAAAVKEFCYQSSVLWWAQDIAQVHFV